MFSAAIKSAAAAVAAAVDPYFKYVTMLLHGDGTNGGQNNTFLDSSTNNFTITRNGNTTQGSFSPYGSNWSNYIDGTSGQYLNAPSNAAFNFGTGDFTIEGWVFPTSTSGTRPIVEIRTAAANSTGFALLSQSGATTLNVYTNGGFVGVSTNSMTTNQWNHVALTRSGNTWTYWINGVSGGSFTNSSTQSDGATTGPKIGGSTTAGEIWVGYLSNIRIVKGTALYTSNFTPSTTPLTAVSGTSLLTCQGNRFLDASSNAFAITVNGSPSVQRFSPFAPSAAYSTATIGGSGYFDGSGDYLGNSTATAIQFGTGDFSVEFWFYIPSAFAADATLIEAQPTSGAFQIYYSKGAGYWVWGSYAGLSVNIGAPSTYQVGAWNHLAVCRVGTTYSAYINGTRTATGTDSTNFSASQFYIGGRSGGSIFYPGYVTDMRVVKGASAYTPSSSTITPPTAPLTAITNTSLLCNFTNGSIFDNAMMNDLETVGNAQISTSVKKYGTGSLAFDGTGDYLKQWKTPNITLNTGAFTFEFWFRTSASTQYMSFFSNENGGGGFTILINSSANNGVVQIYNGGSGLIHASSAGGWNDGNWHFLVLDRDSSGSRLFIDGTQQGSTNAGQASAVFDGGDWIIGNNLAYSGRDYNGYIDDLRITKGYARYTANFTPPTAAFPNN